MRPKPFDLGLDNLAPAEVGYHEGLASRVVRQEPVGGGKRGILKQLASEERHNRWDSILILILVLELSPKYLDFTLKLVIS